MSFAFLWSLLCLSLCSSAWRNKKNSVYWIKPHKLLPLQNSSYFSLLIVFHLFYLTSHFSSVESFCRVGVQSPVTGHWISLQRSLLCHAQLMIFVLIVEGHAGSCLLPLLAFGIVRSHSVCTTPVLQVVFLIFPQCIPAFIYTPVNFVPLDNLFSTFVLLEPRPWVGILNKTVP